MHCNLATGGPGAAMRHAPFGRPRHPLGTFPCGKVPRPPAGGRNLPTRSSFLAQGREKSPPCFSRITKGFASAEATRGLSDRPLDPFGGPPIAGGRNLPQEAVFLRKAGKRAFLAFPVSQKVSPLRRRPGGFPLAPWTPSGAHLLQADETSHKKQVSCGRQGKGPILLSPVSQKVSPLRRRPKGFPIALWKPSDPIPVEVLA